MSMSTDFRPTLYNLKINDEVTKQGRYTLRDIFVWYEIWGFLEKIPIFSYYQNCGHHFKIPHINFYVIGLNRANLR